MKISSRELSVIKLDKLIGSLPAEITKNGRTVYRILKNKPKHTSPHKMISFSEFKRMDKRDINDILYDGPVEIMTGYGKNQRKVFYIMKS